MTTPKDLGPRSDLLADKHAAYVKAFGERKDTFTYFATEHFRMSGVYWGLTTLYLLGRLDDIDAQDMIAWVLGCQREDGGFGGSERHDSHILYTLSAVQILALYDQLDAVDSSRITQYVASLQQPDGSFTGDCWGEVDTRFSYCALCCCSLLGTMDGIDVPKAVEYLVACKNFDGGFGCTPGNESHAGQVFTCVAAFAIADCLHHVDCDLLSWWISERQTKSGGLNGRPEKLQDDEDRGGISDRPEDETDVYHTFFGIAGLSLLGTAGLAAVDPVYALPIRVVQKVKDRQRV